MVQFWWRSLGVVGVPDLSGVSFVHSSPSESLRGEEELQWVIFMGEAV